MSEPTNQCEGCQAGWLVVERYHRVTGAGGYAGEIAACTRDRYATDWRARALAETKRADEAEAIGLRCVDIAGKEVARCSIAESIARRALVEGLAECDRLRGLLFAAGHMRTAPCFACGYNGTGYFQPNQHACAARHRVAPSVGVADVLQTSEAAQAVVDKVMAASRPKATTAARLDEQAIEARTIAAVVAWLRKRAAAFDGFTEEQAANEDAADDLERGAWRGGR